MSRDKLGDNELEKHAQCGTRDGIHMRMAQYQEHFGVRMRVLNSTFVKQPCHTCDVQTCVN